MSAEVARHVPFSIERVFSIYDVPVGVSRGGHAHRSQEQFLVMLAGACTIVAEDESGLAEERLKGPTEGLYVPACVWIELRDFAPGSVCLVLASGPFEERDYIRDYGEFKRVIQ
jgi:hypothetical protein